MSRYYAAAEVATYPLSPAVGYMRNNEPASWRYRMARASRSPLLVLALCATAVLLAGYYTGPGYDPYAPHHFEGLLVDPRTGITLPGQYDCCLLNGWC